MTSHIIRALILAVVAYGARSFEFIVELPTIVTWLADKVLIGFYVLLWVVATYTAINAIRALYNNAPHEPKRKVLLYVALSVTSCIAGYAIAYLHLSSNPKAFNIGTELSPISALYFSIVTFATVGYGDIYPTSDLARFVVLTEIIIGLLYTVLVFSLIAGFIREDTSKIRTSE